MLLVALWVVFFVLAVTLRDRRARRGGWLDDEIDFSVSVPRCATNDYCIMLWCVLALCGVARVRVQLKVDYGQSAVTRKNKSTR